MRPIILTIIAIFVLVWCVSILTHPTGTIFTPTEYQGVSFERLAKISKHIKRPRNRTCRIKTMAWMEVFVHELAHCNGWDHPIGQTAPYAIPERFIHAFPGRLIVTIGEGGKPDDILKYAQKEITIRLSDKRIPDICAYSFEKRPSKKTFDFYRNAGGCAPVGGD